MGFETYNIVRKKDWVCPICSQVFETRAKFFVHKKDTGHKNFFCECYCQFCGKKSTTRSGNTLHERSCSKNPNRVNGATKGYKMTEEQRRHCSEARKRAIAKNGGVWWSSRSKCKRSYAEEWVLKIIHNEVKDQDFIEEYHLNRWFMDFAWPKKQIYIEVDGSQHEWLERKLNDQQKDEYYKSIGWKVLRLPWRYCCSNTQEAIKNIIDFVDNAKSVNISWEDPKEKAQKERQKLIKQGKVNS
jgi:very-short-patch-repair endonuclease